MSSTPSIVEPRRPLAPRLVVAMLAALALVLGPLSALPVAAAPGDTATVSGTLDLPVDDPSTEVTLEARFVSDEGDVSWYYYNNVYSENGSYSFTGVEPGTYRVKSGGPTNVEDGTTPYAVAESAPFAVDGTDVVVPSLALVIGATIGGTTTVDGGAADGDALEGVNVIAARLEGGRYITERQVVSDDTGHYLVQGLRDGTYRLEFKLNGSLGEFYDDVSSADVPDPSGSEPGGIQTVVIANGASASGRDAALTPAAVVSGTVTGSDGPLQGIAVSAYRKVVEDGTSRWEQFNRNDFTGQDGHYSIDLPAGSFRIGFSAQDGTYATEFFDDQASVYSPDVRSFAVTPGDTVTADAVLAPAGSIAGTVTGPDGTAAYACVQAYGTGADSSDMSVPVGYEARTDGNGFYTISDLPAGTYKLRFTGCGGDYVTEYWDDQPTFADGGTVTVGAGTVVDDVDAQLAATPTTADITGTVTDAVSGKTLGGVSVMVEQKDDSGAGDPEWYYAGSGSTDADGAYEVSVDGAGSFRVQFTDEKGVHFSEFNGDVTAAEDAPDIEVAVGDVAVVDAALAPSAALTGMLRGPVGEACPTAYAASDTALTKPYYGSTDFSAGTYLIGGLPAGDFKVRFDCGQFGGARVATAAAAQDPQNWYLGKTSFATANKVVGALGSATGLQPVTIRPRVVTPPVVKRVGASVKVSAKAGRKKATLTITVTAAGVTPTGKVTIKLGSKRLKVVTLRNGRATVTLTKQKKGKRVYSVAYSGDRRVLAKTVKTKKVSIR